MATIAGTSFGMLGEGFVRVSYAAALERIEAAIGRLHDWLAAR